MKHLKTPLAQPVIDWDKPMWVQSPIRIDQIILTDGGDHDEEWFRGTVLPNPLQPTGEHGRFRKCEFIPLTGTIHFPISNDND